MTRPTVLVAAGIVAFLALVTFLGRAPQQPSGPASSSYATTPDGLAAYASLLERAGHDVRRVRASLDDRPPARGEVVVVVDGLPLAAEQRDALHAFVAAGGHAVLAGTAATTLGGRPAAGRDVVQRIGRGTATLVARADPLRNRALDRDDNAARALALAGAPARRVAFVESVHGYHDARGLAALPDRVQTCLWLLGAAALAFLIWRGRRLGPPEGQARVLPPPRRAHVEALAAALARTRDRDTLKTTPPKTETEPT
ncbi:hypothetical protein DSM104299_00358 [Baekduia alba]|uniref:DUF4350 domain-containing protein n=1 Tax=Baekduia alba TaxID=2997333 RepID=UPI00233FC6FF|nr:DUF4350 domain-containing protein [Baekduia alba]WCB91685.1 hypothetical protein DSM104299_00358 [Baekduia alba]